MSSVFVWVSPIGDKSLPPEKLHGRLMGSFPASLLRVDEGNKKSPFIKDPSGNLLLMFDGGILDGTDIVRGVLKYCGYEAVSGATIAEGGRVLSTVENPLSPSGLGRRR